MHEIHVERIELGKPRGFPARQAAAVFATTVPSSDGRFLDTVTLSCVVDGKPRIVTVSATMLTSGSYQRICNAVGIEPR
jgi:hypothetical protein